MWKGAVRDIVIIVLWAVIYAILHFGVMGEPKVRGFFKGDTSIAMPFTESEIVPSFALVICAFVVPILVLLLIFFVVDRVHEDTFDNNDYEDVSVEERLTGVPLIAYNTRNNNVVPESINCDSTSYTLMTDDNLVFATTVKTNSSLDGVTTTPLLPTQSSSPSNGGLLNLRLPPFSIDRHWATNSFHKPNPRNRKIRFALYTMCVFVFLCLTNAIVTNVLKYLIGRLRPDFIARCKPDYTNNKVVIDPDTGYIAAKYMHYLCTGEEADIKEGRLSHPSGHSSSAAFAGIFLAIYIGKRCYNRCTRKIGYFVVPIAQTIFVLSAMFIAASRHIDYRHHFADICMGFLIGAVIAFLSLAFPIFKEPWCYDGSMSSNMSETNLTSSLSLTTSPAPSNIRRSDLPLSDVDNILETEIV